MSFKVNDKHTLEEYNKKYKNDNLAVISKEVADKNQSLLENKSWWLIDNFYYEIKEEKKGFVGWWSNLSKLVRSIIVAVLCAAIIIAIVVPVVIGKKPDNDTEEESYTLSNVDYMDPDDTWIVYSFDKSLTSIKSSETEWIISVTVENNHPYNWYLAIADIASETIIAKSEAHEGKAAPGAYTETIKLIDGINLTDYADKTLTVVFCCQSV